jgi:hypothetical protein
MTSAMGSALITRSPPRRPGAETAGLRLLVLATIVVSVAVFLAPAGASLVAPGAPGSRAAGGPAVTRTAPAGGAAAPLTAAERARVLAYADGLRPDDPLVEVRPGVWAKQSNVAGVRLDGRTVYYDLLGHQSFGPWRRGQVGEADVVVLARAGPEPVRIVVYAPK